MKGVSKWELLGMPATIVFASAYKLGLFQPLGITAEQLPDLMILAFFLLQLSRAAGQARAKKKETADGASKS